MTNALACTFDAIDLSPGSCFFCIFYNKMFFHLLFRKMKRKISLSETDECNNNGIETIQQAKRRRITSSVEYIKKQLQSDLTDKMILPLASPDGKRTSRAARPLHFIKPTFTACKSMRATTVTSKASKRKVRTPNSLDTNNGNASLRLVSKRQITVLSPIDKLINQTKHQLKTDQFQSQLNEKTTISDTFSVEVSSLKELKNMNSDCVTKTEPIEYGLVDFEEPLTTYRVKRPENEPTHTLESESVEKIDLTNTDSEIEEENEPIEDMKPESFSTLEFADSTSSLDASIPHADQFHQDIEHINEVINISSPVSDSVTSTSKSDAIVHNDKPYSDSDDCIIADVYNSDATESWHVGQIVWAALPGFTYWPAIIFNNAEHNTFHNGNCLESIYCLNIEIRI